MPPDLDRASISPVRALVIAACTHCGEERVLVVCPCVGPGIFDVPTVGNYWICLQCTTPHVVIPHSCEEGHLSLGVRAMTRVDIDRLSSCEYRRLCEAQIEAQQDVQRGLAAFRACRN